MILQVTKISSLKCWRNKLHSFIILKRRFFILFTMQLFEHEQRYIKNPPGKSRGINYIINVLNQKFSEGYESVEAAKSKSFSTTILTASLCVKPIVERSSITFSLMVWLMLLIIVFNVFMTGILSPFCLGGNLFTFILFFVQI